MSEPAHQSNYSHSDLVVFQAWFSFQVVFHRQIVLLTVLQKNKSIGKAIYRIIVHIFSLHISLIYLDLARFAYLSTVELPTKRIVWRVLQAPTALCKPSWCQRQLCLTLLSLHISRHILNMLVYNQYGSRSRPNFNIILTEILCQTTTIELHGPLTPTL